MKRLLIVAAVLCALAGSAKAQPLADHVPADSTFYFGWCGTDKLPAGYADSHLKALLDQTNIRTLVSDFLPRLVRRASLANPKLGQGLDIAVGLFQPMLRHPTAIYFEKVDVEQSSPKVYAGIVCAADTDAAEMDRRLALLKQLGGEDVPLTWTKTDNLIDIHIGEPVVQPPAMFLDKAPQFTKTVAQVGADAPLTFYLDFKAVFRMIDAAVARAGNPQVNEYWPRIKQASGLDGLEQLAWGANFDGKDWLDQLFVGAPAPRAGLLALWDGQSLAPDILASVPKSATFVSAGVFDLGKALTTIRDGTTKVDPVAGHLIDQGLGVLTLGLGRNFQHDIVEALGPQWAFYIDPSMTGQGIAGFVLVNKPKDLRKADGALTSIAIALSNTSAGLLRQYGVSLPLEKAKIAGVSVSYIGLPLITPAWATSSDRLFMSFFPQITASAARFVGSKKPTITDDQDFAALQKRLNVPNATSIMYSDLRNSVPQDYQSVLMLARLIFGAADVWGVQAPEPIVPPLEDLLPLLDPAGSATWQDDAGFHAKALSPFPGCELLNGASISPLLANPALWSGFAEGWSQAQAGRRVPPQAEFQP